MYPAPLHHCVLDAFPALAFGLMFWLGIGMPGSPGLVAFVFFCHCHMPLAGAIDRLGLPPWSSGSALPWLSSRNGGQAG